MGKDTRFSSLKIYRVLYDIGLLILIKYKIMKKLQFACMNSLY